LKERLDSILVSRGIVSGRDRAKAVIMAGQVYIDGQKADKAGMQYDSDVEIDFRGEKMKYVSRGGYKLERAMDVFKLSLDGFICMDIGASTGGFTDCMLKCGASKVYSVDVGYGQLAWELRSDERVINMERTNIRYIEPIPDELDFASVDVSFISLYHILPVAKNLLKENGEMVCLIKPQFEAGRGQVGKGGVVRDKEVHKEVINKVLGMARENGFGLLGLTYSPIKGPKGNIEYLMYIKNNSDDAICADVNSVVAEAHDVLDK